MTSRSCKRLSSVARLPPALLGSRNHLHASIAGLPRRPFCRFECCRTPRISCHYRVPVTWLYLYLLWSLLLTALGLQLSSHNSGQRTSALTSPSYQHTAYQRYGRSIEAFCVTRRPIRYVILVYVCRMSCEKRWDSRQDSKGHGMGGFARRNADPCWVKIRSHMRASFRERMRMRAQGDITRELRRAHKVRYSPSPLLCYHPVRSFMFQVVGRLQEGTVWGSALPGGVRAVQPNAGACSKTAASGQGIRGRDGASYFPISENTFSLNI